MPTSTPQSTPSTRIFNSRSLKWRFDSFRMMMAAPIRCCLTGCALIIIALIVLIGLLPITPALGQPPEIVKGLAQAIKKTVNPNVIYDPSYTRIKYPMGDVPADKGVCSDVIIRVYREIGIDLQKEVHEDMKANFSKYPKSWGLKEPDRNIDHRRVKNLMTFFSKHGKTLPITNNPKDYELGDIVCWDLGGGLLHIGIVSDKLIGEYPHNKGAYILHNIGNGQILEDCLFKWKIIGRYRYFGKQ